MLLVSIVKHSSSMVLLAMTCVSFTLNGSELCKMTGDGARMQSTL